MTSERLFAVMYWRWREHENVLTELRERYLQNERLTADLARRFGADLASSSSPSEMMELALRGVRMPSVDVSKFLMPGIRTFEFGMPRGPVHDFLMPQLI